MQLKNLQAMKIFKFGGASVKDANGVKNLLKVIKRKADSNTIVIVSALSLIHISEPTRPY